MKLGSGEWLAVGYLTLVFGSLLSGWFSAGVWYEYAAAFLAGFALSVVAEEIVAILSVRRRTPDE